MAGGVSMYVGKKYLMVLLAVLVFAGNQQIHAWDAMGHGISAEIALDYLSDENIQNLRYLLQQHPRYQQDFLSVMPRFIERANPDRQMAWLLAQAAYWPDIARGLPEAQRQQFNRPTWHYVDGAWSRGAAQSQGNIYLSRPSAPLIEGPASSDITSTAQVNNVMTALDYNSSVLADTTSLPATKAVALCWFLHLAADIHQPLHAGSLFSPRLFDSGDRGGNGINTDSGNLHYRWDSALGNLRRTDNLRQVRSEIDPTLLNLAQQTSTDWSHWLNESRDILRRQVYSNEMRQLIIAREQSNASTVVFSLGADYVQDMQEQSRQRLALAGLRMANWLEANLVN